MTTTSPKLFNGKENKNTLIGLVRRVSRTGRSREGKDHNLKSGLGEAGVTAAEHSSAGYRRVAPSTTTYSSSSSTYIPNYPASRERIVWGRPPATTTEGRTVEGVELVDEGPLQRAGASYRLQQQTYRAASRSKSRDRGSTRPVIESTDERPEPAADLPNRRSIDSLFSSMNVYVPLLPHQDKASTHSSSIPRRAVSVRVERPPKRLVKSGSISSTPRAKPARESQLAANSGSPYQGYWTGQRSDGSNIADILGSEEDLIRQAFRGKGPVWAVARGWKKGIVATFEEADRQTRDFPGPVLRKFDNVDEAIEFLKTPIQSIRPGPPAYGDDDSSTGPRFATPTSMHRQVSQRAASIADSPGNGAKRALRSPSTNPFLTELGRKENLSSDSAPLKSPFFHTEAKNGHVLQNGDYIGALALPPSVIGNSSPSAIQQQQHPTVGISSIVMCQDLDACVGFYSKVLDFTIYSDQRQRGEITMSYNNASNPNLTLRLRDPTLPKMATTTNPSKIPMSMYRSSFLLNVGDCDMSQLHADISSKLLVFQTEMQALTVRRASLSQLRVENIEIKVSIVRRTCTSVFHHLTILLLFNST